MSFKFFFARRALRIWPIYYALLFFAAFAAPAMCWGAVQAHYGQFLGQVCLPLAIFAGNYSLMFPDFLLKFSDAMNVPVIFLLLPLWSLAVEEQFYMTWPFIVNFIKKPATIYKVIGGLMLCQWRYVPVCGISRPMFGIAIIPIFFTTRLLLRISSRLWLVLWPPLRSIIIRKFLPN